MQEIFYIVGTIIIIIGIIFMAFGVAAMFRFNNFYARILTSSKIDTVGVITIVLGMALRHGLSAFTGKILLLLAILFVFNPLVSHILTRSAYLSGHCLKDIDKL